MSATWKKLLKHNWFLAIAAGLCLVLAFPPIEIVAIGFFAPFFLNLLILRCNGFKEGFKFGFLASVAIMLGAFYWVVYVIHMFGNLPWIVAGIIFVGFCGIGALNFPLFVGIAAFIRKKIHLHEKKASDLHLWFTLGFPVLFTVVEWCVPKLFPWYISHSLYQTRWLNQVVELTGCTFLSFAIYSLGSTVGLFFLQDLYPNLKPKAKTLLVPACLWVFILGFSVYRLNFPYTPPAQTEDFRVALVQANVGSLDKARARKGVGNIVRHVYDTYTYLTEVALKDSRKPDLVVWPETAMPFYLMGSGRYIRELREKLRGWQVPLISGGYAPYRDRVYRDYNAAYLLDPIQDNLGKPAIYNKNILLAFGETMPFGHIFPILYRWIPQVANFKTGETQPTFELHDKKRIGVTICYEAIVPSFYRKITRQGVQAVVNLTNDSWFGPTSEPYQHGALSVFRAIESRVPLFRVTNTGESFMVDATGKKTNTIGTFTEGHLSKTIPIPNSPPLTPYTRFGDWFVIVCSGLLLFILKKDYASLFV